MSVTYQLDDTYCPKGHGEWVLIPSGILYSDIYYCPVCVTFYQPRVIEITSEEINKEFSSDRAGELKQRAMFLKARKEITPKDIKILEEIRKEMGGE